MQYAVTTPNGKVYTFSSLTRATVLANRVGTQVRPAMRPVRTAPQSGPCPHGSTFGFCDKGACDE